MYHGLHYFLDEVNFMFKWITSLVEYLYIGKQKYMYLYLHK